MIATPMSTDTLSLAGCGAPVDTQKIRLAAGELHVMRLAADETVALRIRSGELWVTLEGDATDHLLGSGDVFRAEGPGLLVAEALGGAVAFEAEARGKEVPGGR